VHAAKIVEKIESDISSRNIAIESNFTGSRIVVFGTIENSRQTESEIGLYDIAVVIRGPKRTIITRRKSKVAGIWINQEAHTFANAPGFYAVMSNRPLPDIAKQKVLDKYGLGFHSLDFKPVDPGSAEPLTGDLAEFREAAVRIKQKEGLYNYDPTGVVFVGRTLFRATVDLPVPAGPSIVTITRPIRLSLLAYPCIVFGSSINSPTGTLVPSVTRNSSLRDAIRSRPCSHGSRPSDPPCRGIQARPSRRIRQT